MNTLIEETTKSPTIDKACPFCGMSHTDALETANWKAPAVALHQWPGPVFVVQCEGCGCSGPLADTGREAIDKWNGRKV